MGKSFDTGNQDSVFGLTSCPLLMAKIASAVPQPPAPKIEIFAIQRLVPKRFSFP